MSERGGVLQGNFIENFRINTSFVKHRKITFRLHFLYMLSQFQKTSYFYVLYRLLYFRRNFYTMTQWSVPTESSILTLPSNFLHDMDWSYSIFQLKSRHHPQSESDSRTDLHTAGYSVWHSIQRQFFFSFYQILNWAHVLFFYYY